MVRKAVIPAAGLGTRLYPLTRSQPKELVACGRAPVIGYILDELRGAGITDILLISRSGKGALEEYVFDAWPGSYLVRQPEQKGLGHALLYARAWVGAEPFVVALGDTIISSPGPVQPLNRMVEKRRDDGASVVLVREVPLELVSRYGVVSPVGTPESSELFRVSDIIEKPSPEQAPGNLAVAGRYLFAPDIFPALDETPPAKDGEILLTDAMRRLSGDTGSLYAACLALGERRFDIGNFDSYFEAFAALAH